MFQESGERLAFTATKVSYKMRVYLMHNSKIIILTTSPLFRQKSDCIPKLKLKDFVWYHYDYYVY